eukprot:4681257-Pyramimonas_sp.AAC.1
MGACSSAAVCSPPSANHASSATSPAAAAEAAAVWRFFEGMRGRGSVQGILLRGISVDRSCGANGSSSMGHAAEGM